MDWPEIFCRLKGNTDDELAWSALGERVRPIAQRALGHRGLATVDDAIADTCSSVLMGIARARGPETFAGFVFGHFLNVRRRYMLRSPTVSVEDTAVRAATVDIADDPRVATLQACLTELPPRERQAVELRYFHDCHADEIAARLGVTTVNARRILFNAMTHLRQRMLAETEEDVPTLPVESGRRRAG